MNKILDIFRRSFVWLVRFRHRCGYGIHSPFAFSVVTGVIYERGEYYAYSRLKALREKQICTLREKDDRLLFRLSNASMAKEIVVYGSCSPITLEYIAAGRKNASIKHIFNSDFIEKSEPIDFLYISDSDDFEEVFRKFLPLLSENAFVVIRGIRHKKHSLDAWKRIISLQHIRVTFDLYDFGLLCLEPRFNKENHIINYF